jgi:tetratricopeptide (TPR) repeat protein
MLLKFNAFLRERAMLVPSSRVLKTGYSCLTIQSRYSHLRQYSSQLKPHFDSDLARTTAEFFPAIEVAQYPLLRRRFSTSRVQAARNECEQKRQNAVLEKTEKNEVEVKNAMASFKAALDSAAEIDGISNTHARVQVQECMVAFRASYGTYKQNGWLDSPMRFRIIWQTEVNRMLRLITSRLGCVSDVSEDLTSQAHASDLLDRLAKPYIILKEYLRVERTLFTDERRQHEQRLHFENLAFNHKSILGYMLNSALQEIRKLSVNSNYNIPANCFISYAWPTAKNKLREQWIQPFLHRLSDHLRIAGIRALVDQKDNRGGSLYTYTDELYSDIEENKVGCAILVGTKSLKDKHDKATSAVCNELSLLNRMRRLDDRSVIPILLSGDIEQSFPAYMEMYTTISDWHEGSYFANLKTLLRRIYRISSRSRTRFDDIWEELEKNVSELTDAGLLISSTGLGLGYFSERDEINLSLIQELFPRAYSGIRFNPKCYTNIYLTSHESAVAKTKMMKRCGDLLRVELSVLTPKVLAVYNECFASGKNILVKAYVKNISNKIPKPGMDVLGKNYRWLLDASSKESLQSSLEDLLFDKKSRTKADFRTLKERQISVMMALNNFLNKNEQWVLVYENAPSKKEIGPYLPDYSLYNGTIIITTQKSDFFDDPSRNRYFDERDFLDDIHRNRFFDENDLIDDPSSNHYFYERGKLSNNSEKSDSTLVLRQQLTSSIGVSMLSGWLQETYLPEALKISREESRNLVRECLEPLQYDTENTRSKSGGSEYRSSRKVYKKLIELYLKVEKPLHSEVLRFLSWIMPDALVPQKIILRYHDLLEQVGTVVDGALEPLVGNKWSYLDSPLVSPCDVDMSSLSLSQGDFFYSVQAPALSIMWETDREAITKLLDESQHADKIEQWFFKFKRMFKALNHKPSESQLFTSNDTVYLPYLESLIDTFDEFGLKDYMTREDVDSSILEKFGGIYPGMLYCVAKCYLKRGEVKKAKLCLEKSLTYYTAHRILLEVTKQNSKAHNVTQLYQANTNYRLAVCHEQLGDYSMQRVALDDACQDIFSILPLSEAFGDIVEKASTETEALASNTNTVLNRPQPLTDARFHFMNAKNVAEILEVFGERVAHGQEGVSDQGQVFDAMLLFVRVAVSSARYYANIGRYNKSVQILEELSGWVNSCKLTHPNFQKNKNRIHKIKASILSNLGSARRFITEKNNSYSRSPINNLSDAINLQKALGPIYQVRTTQIHLASIWGREGKYQRQINELEKLINKTVTEFGHYHLLAARASSALGKAYADKAVKQYSSDPLAYKKNLDKGMRNLILAMGIFDRLDGPDAQSPDIALATERLGYIRYLCAKAILDQSLNEDAQSCQYRVGAPDDSTAKKVLREARAYLEKSLQMKRKLYNAHIAEPDQHIAIVRSMVLLVGCYSLLGSGKVSGLESHDLRFLNASRNDMLKKAKEIKSLLESEGCYIGSTVQETLETIDNLDVKNIKQ